MNNIKIDKTNIIYNKHGFEYDVYGLTKAFLPDTEILEFFQGNPIKNFLIGENELIIKVDFLEDNILLTIKTNITSIEFNNSIVGLDRGKQKNLLKNIVYEGLSKLLNKKLPWGTLTGIRPTKLAYDFLKYKKYSSFECFKALKNKYKLSDVKAQLITDIGLKEISIINDNLTPLDNSCSIYLAIPFCPTVCDYCSFSLGTYSFHKDKVRHYLESLIDELRAFIDYNNSTSKRRIDSLYIGGGTPSGLDKNDLEFLLDNVEEVIDTKALKEYTFEAGRPDTITEDLLHTLSKYNITRLSINPQTLNSSTLKNVHRAHGSEDFFKAVDIAKKAGFRNINSDLIIGLEGESFSDMKSSVEGVISSGVEGITIHALAVKRATSLHELGYSHGLSRALDNSYQKLYKDIFAILKQNNYRAYYLYRQKNSIGNLENIGFSKDNYEGIYNILMIEERQSVIGFGAGASSKLVKNIGGSQQIERVESVKNIQLYIDRKDEMLNRKIKGLEKLGI